MRAVRSSAVESNEALVRRVVEIMRTGEVDALREVLHPDFIQEMPQSRERVRGRENAVAIFKNYPGGAAGSDVEAEEVHVLGARPRYVMTPTFNVIQVEGSGDTYTVWAKSRYPDGSVWYAVSILTLKDGQVAKQVAFFAPVFPPPEWRAQWVELMEP